jgi:hypothetical protein
MNHPYYPPCEYCGDEEHCAVDCPQFGGRYRYKEEGKMGYRKLTDEEVKNMLNCRTDGAPKWVKDYLSKYYKQDFTISKVILLVDSEYNDSSYDNKIVGLIALDKEGNEISPIKGKSVEARAAFISLDERLEESYNPMENISYLIGNLPELYVKE